MRASRLIFAQLRLLALSLLAGLLIAGPAQAKRVEFYTAEQLHFLLSGSKLTATGICITGSPGDLTFDFVFNADGTFSADWQCITQHNAYLGTEQGTWSVEDDELCIEVIDGALHTERFYGCWPVGHGKYQFGLYSGDKIAWQLNVSHPKFPSKEKLLAALDELSDRREPDTSPMSAALPPAEYKPLPVGTRVRYDNWSFTVTRSDGFETVVKDNKNRRYVQRYAIFGRQGEFVYTFRGSSSTGTISTGGGTRQTAFNEKQKSVLESLWPLEVGRKSELNFEEEFHGRRDYGGVRNWRLTLEVVGTAFVELDGLTYPTFVIKSHAVGEAVDFQYNSYPVHEFTETYWFNPDSGLVLKFEREWIRGDPLGAEDRYELVGVRYPEGTATHALKGTKPSGEADKELLAEVQRLKGEAAAAHKAEEARKAEIAKLRREAAEARRAVEDRKVREAEEDQARGELIAKLRRELDDRRAAEEARKGKEAEEDKARAQEIAQLRRQAEAARNAAEARKAQEAEEEKAREAEIARLRQAVEEKSKNEAGLTEHESKELEARLAEIAQLKKAAQDRRQAEQARKAREAEEEKIRAAEIARLRQEAAAARTAVAARAAGEVAEKEARAQEIARLRKDAEEARQAVEARKAREAEKERTRAEEMALLKDARAADVARLKQEIENRRKAEEARKAREAEDEKIRLAEIAALKKDIESRQKREAEAAKRREAEIARIQREADEARKTREAKIAELSRAAEAARKEEAARTVREAEARKAREAEIASLRRQLEEAREAREGERDQAPGGIEGIEFGRYHALVIGIDRYKYLPKLKTAVKDAKAIARVLIEEYGFRVRLLTNPDHAEIIDALDEYRETLGPKDNLLIYYAGHGWLDEEADRGYWLPANARPKRRSRWVSNATVTDTLKTLAAKHVMVVADSCYSGTLVRSADVGPRTRTGDYWKQMAEKWARVAITSGGLEPVADKGDGGHSPFAKAFIDALNDNATVMDGTQLFSKMRRPVMVAAQQTPQYADVRQAGHDGGDFLFVRKK